MAGLPLDGFAPCDPGVPWQRYYAAPLEQEVEPMGLLGFLEPLRGRDVISYCGKTFPGFEADVVANSALGYLAEPDEIAGSVRWATRFGIRLILIP